jgi:hypothetical protein
MSLTFVIDDPHPTSATTHHPIRREDAGRRAGARQRMSEGHTIDGAGDEVAGIVVRYEGERGFRFHSASKAYDALAGHVFVTPAAAQRAAQDLLARVPGGRTHRHREVRRERRLVLPSALERIAEALSNARHASTQSWQPIDPAATGTDPYGRAGPDRPRPGTTARCSTASVS